jgi:Family of unknown function (DUF6225)
VSDSEELFHHEVTPWTVGQLRKALQGLPGYLPIRVLYAEEPGGDTAAEQVLIGAGFGTGTIDDGSQYGRDFLLSCEYSSGEYSRPRRS